MIEKVEYFIINYVSGEECINNLDLEPDLIILDFNLLGMNGIDALIEIREHSNELPVVLTHETDIELVNKF